MRLTFNAFMLCDYIPQVGQVCVRERERHPVLIFPHLIVSLSLLDMRIFCDVTQVTKAHHLSMCTLDV